MTAGAGTMTRTRRRRQAGCASEAADGMMHCLVPVKMQHIISFWLNHHAHAVACTRACKSCSRTTHLRGELGQAGSAVLGCVVQQCLAREVAEAGEGPQHVGHVLGRELCQCTLDAACEFVQQRLARIVLQLGEGPQRVGQILGVEAARSGLRCRGHALQEIGAGPELQRAKSPENVGQLLGLKGAQVAVRHHEDVAKARMLQHGLRLRRLVLGQPVQAGGHIDGVKELALVDCDLQDGGARGGGGDLLVDLCRVGRAGLPGA